MHKHTVTNTNTNTNPSTYRRSRARLDPEAVIELTKPEEPKEGEAPFGTAFPNIEYEEPARMQVCSCLC